MSTRRSVLVAVLVSLAACSMVLAAQGRQGKRSIRPFNGKDLSGWKMNGDAKQSKWVVGTATLDPANPAQLKVTPGGKELINAAGAGVDLYTEPKFGDAVIDLEVMVPKGSNSGIYVMGEVEIQVLDSFGRDKPGMGDMGAIYSYAVPKVNASKKPGEWQHCVIDYRAPKFDAQGKKTANARIVKITLNDQVIQEDVELKGVTPGGVSGKEAATGPLMFQGNHGPVAFRNIRIRPVAAK
ncbi:MAG: 3-keto-disaccharide hydrolase [Pirellulales bacterium]